MPIRVVAGQVSITCSDAINFSPKSPFQSLSGLVEREFYTRRATVDRQDVRISGFHVPVLPSCVPPQRRGEESLKPGCDLCINCTTQMQKNYRLPDVHQILIMITEFAIHLNDLHNANRSASREVARH